jgi:hypothetical protein
MKIFTVHFNYYKACLDYIPYCYRATLENNPDSECHFLTPSADLAGELKPLEKSFNNARVALLDKSFTDACISDVDEIFHHDGYNSRQFDVFSFARHILVKKYMANVGITDTGGSFLTTDSDIAHFCNYNRSYPQISRDVIFSQSPIVSYFAHWGWDAFSTYTDLGLMNEYFVHARQKGGRCSDMHLLEWLIKDKALLTHQWDRRSFGVPLDTISHFLYYSGLWSEQTRLDDRQVLNEYPRGIWNDREFLKSFMNTAFWKAFLLVSSLPTGQKRIFLLRNHLLRSIGNVRSASVKAEASSHMLKWGDWVHNHSWQAYLSLHGDLVPVPFLHFQGATKSLAPYLQLLTHGKRD